MPCISAHRLFRLGKQARLGPDWRKDPGSRGRSWRSRNGWRQVPREWPLGPWLVMSKTGSCKLLHSTNQQTFLTDLPGPAAHSLMGSGSQDLVNVTWGAGRRATSECLRY